MACLRRVASVAVISLVLILSGITISSMVAKKADAGTLCGTSSDSYCWKAGAMYGTSPPNPQWATFVKGRFTLPTIGPVTDEYAVTLTAEDNAGSYDQIALRITSSGIEYGYHYGWACANNCPYDPVNCMGQRAPTNPISLTVGNTYSFWMYFTAGNLNFEIDDRTGSPVPPFPASIAAPHGATGFLISQTYNTMSTCNTGPNDLPGAYSWYEEEFDASSTPVHSWRFYDVQDSIHSCPNMGSCSGSGETNWVEYRSDFGTEAVPGHVATRVSDGNVIDILNWAQKNSFVDSPGFSWDMQDGANSLGGPSNRDWTVYRLSDTGARETYSDDGAVWQTPAKVRYGPKSSVVASNTVPALSYISTGPYAGKWLVAWTDPSTNNIKTMLSIDGDFYHDNWDATTLKTAVDSTGATLTTLVHIGLTTTQVGTSTYTYMSVMAAGSNLQGPVNLYRTSNPTASWTRLSTMPDQGRHGSSITPCCGALWLAMESTESPGNIIVYGLDLTLGTVSATWTTLNGNVKESTADRPTIGASGPYLYLVWPDYTNHHLNMERFNFSSYSWGDWKKITISDETTIYKIGLALFGVASPNTGTRWVIVWTGTDPSKSFNTRTVWEA